MKNIVWVIVILLVIGWMLGFFFFAALGSIIHIVLVIADILIIYKLVTGRKV